MVRFHDLQSRLGAVVAANVPGSTIPHVLVALPSYSLGESLLSHYAARLPALEHRYLLSHLLLPRIESCEFVLVTCAAPSAEVLEYYLGLVPADRREGMRARLRILEVPDDSHRPVAAKLLDRPDLIVRLRDSLHGRPAFIEPWNVTEVEVEVACRLGIPINGTAPELWPLGFKSAGRRLFAETGVPTPVGCENLRSLDDVAAAVAQVRARRPHARGVVVKTDNSGAGDGNRVVPLAEGTTSDEVRRLLEAFPEWYRADLAAGCVVEELVAGPVFSSPSVQVDILPDGDVIVLSTHEQVFGGPESQVYNGCRFPADPAYAARLARHGEAVGRALASRGAVGRISVDFAATRSPRGHWDVYALEINLRKGGTTHPYSVLRHLAPGCYEPGPGLWVTEDGQRRFYESTDNLLDPGWLGRPAGSVIRTVAEAGLQFDPGKRTGVVLHMLSCLAIDGRLGLTAIGESAEHASALYGATVDALSALQPVAP
jgi:hypothetical protein